MKIDKNKLNGYELAVIDSNSIYIIIAIIIIILYIVFKSATYFDTCFMPCSGQQVCTYLEHLRGY